MILDGKAIAQQIQDELRHRIEVTASRKPGLAVILVGDHPASLSYVTSKQKACERVGMVSQLHQLPVEVDEEVLLAHIDGLNRDPHVDGILVQLPLPTSIHEERVLAAIDPSKDVDGFHPVNVGKMLLGHPDALLPCTPHGIKVLLERSHIDVSGKHVVIVGRSNIVGKPMAAILMQKAPHCNATVTVAHSGSEDLVGICQSADILIAAVGKQGLITSDHVRDGAVVIDVGIHRVADSSRPKGYRITGDVDFEAVQGKVRAITPVPGGVGPMTIAMLLQNTLTCYERRHP